MLTVTTLELDSAFRTALQGLVPTFEPMRDTRWAYVETGRRGAMANLQGRETRTYTTIWGVGEPNYLWVGGIGTAYQARCAFATSYAGTDPAQLNHMLTADHVDLRRVLNALRDPVVGGLSDVIDRGLTNVAVDDDGNAYVEHDFLVHYHQALA